MSGPPRPPLTLTFSRHGWVRLVSICAVVALPWITPRLYSTWLQTEQDRAVATLCRHFLHADAGFGWQAADQLLVQVQTTGQAVTADFAATYQSAVDQLQLHIDHTPHGVLRLHALRVNVSTSRLGSREVLGGGHFLLSGQAGHSPENASALYVDLPARGGSFTVLNLTTPCGVFRQEFSLLERTGKTTVQVVTKAEAKVISTATIDVASTDGGS